MFVTAALLIRLGLAAMATGLAPAPSRAACQVELQPGDAPRAWIVAAAAVRDSLRERADSDRDCRAVVIHANGERASVEVVTLDGRHGVRRLADASDVAATVAALIVTVRADAVESVSADVRPPALAAPPTVDAHSPGWRLQVVVGGGGRWSKPGTQAAQLELSLGVARPGWELGLFGAWAPAAMATSGQAQPAFSSTAEAAIGGAWRPSLGGSGIDVFVGGRAGIIRLADVDSMADTGGNNLNFDGVAPAFTGVVGAVFATRAVVHVRPQLWYQWIPATRLGSDSNADGALSSVGLSLGVESRLP